MLEQKHFDHMRFELLKHIESPEIGIKYIKRKKARMEQYLKNLDDYR